MTRTVVYFSASVIVSLKPECHPQVRNMRGLGFDLYNRPSDIFAICHVKLRPYGKKIFFFLVIDFNIRVRGLIWAGFGI